MEDSTVLPPCPFCGGKASANGTARYDETHEAWFADGTRITEAFFCNCTACGITNKGLCGHQTREKAIAAWSERRLAEQAYIDTAFDYVNAPIGSRDWAIFWGGWQAGLNALRTSNERPRAS